MLTKVSDDEYADTADVLRYKAQNLFQGKKKPQMMVAMATTKKKTVDHGQQILEKAKQDAGIKEEHKIPEGRKKKVFWSI